QVEKIDFGADSYTAYVRGSSIGIDRFSAVTADTNLWRLSPIRYWTDRNTVSHDLINQQVNVSGVRTTKSCDPACGLAVEAFAICSPSCTPGAKDTEEALRLFETDRQRQERYANVSIAGMPPGYYPFARYFDANDPLLIKGVIAKVEFVNPVAQVWISSSSVN